jgi:hypothetical protein
MFFDSVNKCTLGIYLLKLNLTFHKVLNTLSVSEQTYLRSTNGENKLIFKHPDKLSGRTTTRPYLNIYKKEMYAVSFNII